MVRLILSDYLCTRKEAAKSVMEKGGWFVYLYCILFIPTLMQPKGTDYNSIFGIEMLIMLITLLISRMYPNRLGKNMYLAPLSKKERMRYLQQAYYLRSGFAMALFIVCNVVMLLLHELTLKEVGILLYTFTLFTLTVNYYVAETGKSPYRKEEELIKKNSKFKFYTGFMITAQCTAVLLYIIYLPAVSGAGYWENWENAFMILLLVAQAVIYLRVKCYYEKLVFEIGINYEDCY